MSSERPQTKVGDVPDFELQQIQKLVDLHRRIEDADFGSLPLELGRVSRGLGSDRWSDEEILEHVSRHQRGDFGEYGRFESNEITDANRRGDVESLSFGQINRKRIEMREPAAVTSKYVTDKGTLYITSETHSTYGRQTVAYGPEGR
jgi:hypothetical protein